MRSYCGQFGCRDGWIDVTKRNSQGVAIGPSTVTPCSCRPNRFYRDSQGNLKVQEANDGSGNTGRGDVGKRTDQNW